MAIPRALPLLLLALTLAPLALAQQEARPVLLERVDGGGLAADVGDPANATFHLFNLNPADDFYVTVSVTQREGWRATPDTGPFFLGPRNATNVTVTFDPASSPRGVATFDVAFSLVHGRTGQVVRDVQTVEVDSSAAPRIVGLFANPLPPPLDNTWGSFALSMLFWVGVAVLAVFLWNGLARVVMARAQGETVRGVVRKLTKPIFFLVLLLGLSSSFALLPRNGFVSFIEKFLIAIAITVFGLYVLYRVLEAALLYYQREIAPRTATKVDDVLVPALRKVGLVIVYVAGIILTLRTLGWDPTLVFAGAGIAGLVIAFAAQDTFSNLFSGIFLMLDRPFVEGDVILLETGEVARVESIGLRTTDLYEYDHHHVITVPNNQLATKRIVNYSAPDSNFRVDIFVGVSYDADLRAVEKILREVARDEPEVVNEAPWEPSIQLREFTDSACNMMLRVTLNDPRDRNRVPSKIRHEIKRRFDAAGIEIPYPQRVVHLRGELPR
ncbi:MAG TPA: mechanosensitive ion channel family protein [Candidatus Thermoplasmatota archaeon]|nr:mechanosensitive ion channel family protein [Candidatus Thermoplasmatota archaeon]